MEKILDKIDSYNIFTNIIPGSVLTKLLVLFDLFTVQVEGAVANLILYYFFGVVASRVGSLIVEKSLLILHMVNYAPLEEYLKAAQKDLDIRKLLEVNNMYRTFAGVFIILVIIKAYQMGANVVNLPPTVTEWIAVIAMLLLFVLSFIKQTKSIVKRVTAVNVEDNRL